MNFCRFLRLISVIVTLTLKRQFFYINNVICVTWYNCFTVKVFVSNLKVEKRENLDNALYVFLRFLTWHFKKGKKSRFLNFQKNVKNVFSNYAGGHYCRLCTHAISYTLRLAYIYTYLQ